MLSSTVIPLFVSRKNLGLIDTRRHVIHNWEWEVQRVFVDEVEGLPVSRDKIQKGVRKIVMARSLTSDWGPHHLGEAYLILSSL